MSDAEADDWSPLPISAKYIYHVLDEDGPLARQELLDRVELNERTLDRALDRLQNGDYVDKTRNPMDLRQVVYEIDDNPDT